MQIPSPGHAAPYPVVSRYNRDKTRFAGVYGTQLLPKVDRRELTGPFDIIGDVHGCYDELVELLTTKLGYVQRGTFVSQATGLTLPDLEPTRNRKLLFVGDLVDRGPKIIESVELIRHLAQKGQALVVMGNHDDKVLRYCQNDPSIQLRREIKTTVDAIAKLPPNKQASFKAALVDFFSTFPSHMILDNGKLVLCHAGLRYEHHGKNTPEVYNLATQGQNSLYKGVKKRVEWGLYYPVGHANTPLPLVVHGHTQIPQPKEVNNTLDIDTGCVYGGALTAFNYPERTFVSVKADPNRTHWQDNHPWGYAPLTNEEEAAYLQSIQQALKSAAIPKTP